MAATILQIIFFQLLFLLVYELLLKKETFFNYNRWYLLITPVVALILPFLNIAALTEFVPQESVTAINSIWLPEVFIGNTPQAMQTLPEVHLSSQNTSINWWMLIYGFGIILSFGIVLKKFLNLRKLFQFNLIKIENTYRIIEVPSSNLACTFYKTIFLGDRLLTSEKEQILAHELIHVKEKHSIDLVFFEIFKIVFWFNPLIYIYQNRIATLHEYIADANVVATTPKSSYYQQLLNSAFNTQNISFINQFFNHSLIKKRIVMLQKSKSKTIAKIKYVVLLPLVIMMLTIVSCSEKEEAQIDSSNSVIIANDIITLKVKDLGNWTEEEKEKIDVYMAEIGAGNSYQTLIIKDDKKSITIEPSGNMKVQRENDDVAHSENVDVPFGVIDQVPIFPGCENLGSNEEQKKCMTSKITDFVGANFDTSIGKALKLTGVNRVIVQFKIDETGNIVNVRARAPHPDLETEAKRVINALPKMVPGKHNGQDVGVMYSLPIVFQVNE